MTHDLPVDIEDMECNSKGKRFVTAVIGKYKTLSILDAAILIPGHVVARDAGQRLPIPGQSRGFRDRWSHYRPTTVKIILHRRVQLQNIKCHVFIQEAGSPAIAEIPRDALCHVCLYVELTAHWK